MSTNPFQPGDWADHVSGRLDPREVAKVEGDQIWLHFFGEEPMGPFPAENYDLYRRAPQPDADGLTDSEQALLDDPTRGA